MTDRYAKIRQALEMGPTRGPWTQATRGPNGCPVVASGPLMIAMLAHSTNEHDQVATAEANAAHIVACDPDAVRELLGERDKLRAFVQNMEVKGPDEDGYVWLITKGLDGTLMGAINLGKEGDLGAEVALNLQGLHEKVRGRGHD